MPSILRRLAQGISKQTHLGINHGLFPSWRTLCDQLHPNPPEREEVVENAISYSTQLSGMTRAMVHWTGLVGTQAAVCLKGETLVWRPTYRPSSTVDGGNLSIIGLPNLMCSHAKQVWWLYLPPGTGWRISKAPWLTHRNYSTKTRYKSS